MASAGIPPIPVQLKAIQHYMKTATEHDKRDPVVAYYCRLYAMQKGMAIDMKTPECRSFLVTLMDFLEKAKKELYQSDAIESEVVGQAHMEDYALKVFLFADNEDRAARFNKNVVKSFYTAGMLFDVLTVFGELSEDIEKNLKYAKWKAAYIHRCLKSGETPIAGPLPEEGDGEAAGGAPQPSSSTYINSMDSSLHTPSIGAFAPPSTPQDPPQNAYPPPDPSVYQPPVQPVFPPQQHVQPMFPPQQPVFPPQQPVQPMLPPQQPVSGQSQQNWIPPPNPAGVDLKTEDYQKAIKFCRHANSALQYEDSKAAIDNLQKCLRILTTGKPS